MKFPLVRELAHEGFPVALTCRVLNLPRSTFYDRDTRSPSARDAADEGLLAEITEIHALSRETYGAPSVHAELRLGRGHHVGRKRIARLMRRAGIQRGLSPPQARTASGAGDPRRPRQASLRSPRAEPTLGHGHHRTPRERRTRLLRRGARCLQPADRGLVDRGPRAQRVGRRRPADGDLAPPARRRRHRPRR